MTCVDCEGEGTERFQGDFCFIEQECKTCKGTGEVNENLR